MPHAVAPIDHHVCHPTSVHEPPLTTTCASHIRACPSLHQVGGILLLALSFRLEEAGAKATLAFPNRLAYPHFKHLCIVHALTRSQTRVCLVWLLAPKSQKPTKGGGRKPTTASGKSSFLPSRSHSSTPTFSGFGNEKLPACHP